jgi:hypothetical protein
VLLPEPRAPISAHITSILPSTTNLSMLHLITCPAVNTLERIPNPGGARAIARRSRELATAAGDAWCLCDATQVLSFAHLYCGECEQATALLDVLPLIGQTGSAELAAGIGSGTPSRLRTPRKTQRCRSLAERAMACADEVGEVVSGAFAAATLAHLEIRQGRSDTALR